MGYVLKGRRASPLVVLNNFKVKISMQQYLIGYVIIWLIIALVLLYNAK